MRFSRLYLLVIALVIVDSQFARGAESLKRRDASRRIAERDEDKALEHLRSLIKTADLSAVSYIFTKSKNVTVARGGSGQIRILVGEVSDELLKTKINVVSFTPSERYNGQEAVIPITRTNEVQAKLRKLRIAQPLLALTGLMQESRSGLPHLPASMKNVTMDEALDRVAQTFRGVIIYGEWTSDGARLFSVAFAPVAAFEPLARRSR